MASRADTKALGLHGLFIEAQRRDDHDQRAGLRRGSGAHRARARLGRHGGARSPLRGRRLGRRAGAARSATRARSTRTSYRRQRAVHADRARARRRGYRPRQPPRRSRSKRPSSRRPWCRRRRSPAACWPKAASCARPTASSTRPGAPIRIPIWRRAYADLRFGDAARDRLKRIEALAKTAPGHVEGALAVARAALDAREFAKARAALAPYLDGADQARRAADGRAGARRAATTRAAPANGWRARSMPRPIRHGRPTATSPTAGCRCRPSAAGSTPSNGACRSPAWPARRR